MGIKNKGMRNLRNKNAPPTTGLVQSLIDTAYDNVKIVSDNLDAVNEVAQAIADGLFTDLVYVPDIDTLAELNAIVADEEIASEAYVNDAVTGLYDFKGGYNADTNTPDLITAPNGILVADSYQVTDAGTFFTANLEPGDQLTAIIDNPATEADWSIVNRNIDSAAFATSTQGDTADAALQPGDNISLLTNDSAYADDQTPAEIAVGYDTAVAIVTQVEAEAGVSTTSRRWNALRVAQAAKAQLGAITFVIANHTAVPSQMVFCDSSVGPITVTLPPGVDKINVWIIDAGHNAGVNNITIIPDGGGTDTVDGAATFILDQNDNFCNAAFNAANTDWRLALSGVPDLIEQAPHTHPEYAKAGFSGINPQVGLTYTFVALDLEEGVTASNVAGSVYSIPDAFGSVGDLINLYNLIGSGEVTIAMAGTDTLDTTNNNCVAGAAVSIEKISATVWAVIGGTVAP